MICLIVEGQNDKKKIQDVFEEDIRFIVLEGINFSPERKLEIENWLRIGQPIYILTDPDTAGDGVAKRIQGQFPEIERIQVQPEKARILKSKGYKYGVEYCSHHYLRHLLSPKFAS